MRRFGVLMSLAMLLTTFASAQVLPLLPLPICVEGVIGRGLLGSRDPGLPRRIEFAMEVYHYELSCPEGVCDSIRGYFRLRAWDESGATVSLYTERIEEFSLEQTPDGWLATFSGPGVATVSRGGVVRSFRGRIDVQALDGRPSPCLECPTDRLRVTFTSPQLPEPITFEGYVIPRTGDIQAFRRCR
ncbi:hypothetical protein HRbin15_00106 [bacterium HR15]|nr:hypothetical protein HRbin15_00106 [bacterium HR15]